MSLLGCALMDPGRCSRCPVQRATGPVNQVPQAWLQAAKTMLENPDGKLVLWWNDPRALADEDFPRCSGLRPADLGVGGLLGKGIGMHGLMPLAHEAGSNRNEAEVGVADHHSLRLAALRLDHIRAVDRHRVSVPVVFERRRRRPKAAVVSVPYEVPLGNPSQ